MSYSYLNGLLAVYEKKQLGANELRLWAESPDRQALRAQLDKTMLGPALGDHNLDAYPQWLSRYLELSYQELTKTVKVSALRELLWLQLKAPDLQRGLKLAKQLNSALTKQFLVYELDLQNLLILLQLRELERFNDNYLFIAGGSLDVKTWQQLLTPKTNIEFKKLIMRLQPDLHKALVELEQFTALRVESVARAQYLRILLTARKSVDSAARICLV